MQKDKHELITALCALLNRKAIIEVNIEEIKPDMPHQLKKYQSELDNVNLLIAVVQSQLPLNGANNK